MKNVWLLALLMSGLVSAKPEITLTAENEYVDPRDVVTIRATHSGENASDFMLYGPDGFYSGRDKPPFMWSLNISRKFAGERLYQVVGVVDGQAVKSNDLVVTVRPDLTQLRSIKFTRPEITLEAGMTLPVSLRGYFPDHVEYELGQSGWLGLSELRIDGYSEGEGDSPVIDIHDGGMVEALEPGRAAVWARYGGLYARIDVSVVPDPAKSNASN